MSICDDCSRIGGYHTRWCASRIRTTTQPAPKPRDYRIEWFGTLQVHQPVKR